MDIETPLRPHSLLALESHRLQLAVWAMVRSQRWKAPWPPVRMDLQSSVTERFYVRVGWSCLDTEMNPAITLANVSVLPCYQRQGFMTRVLHLLSEMGDAERLSVVIENVLNDEWAEWLRRKGWKEITPGPSCRGLAPPNFYRLPAPQREIRP